MKATGLRPVAFSIVGPGNVHPYQAGRAALPLLAVVLAVLMFAGGPGPDAARSVSRGWDLGHILAFFVWTTLWLETGVSARMPARRRWLVTLASCAILAMLTESVQLMTGGDASFGDAMRDVLGGALALAWVDRAPGGMTKAVRRAVRAASLLLLLAALVPVSAAVVDEWQARRAFPVLADFETRFEAGRWDGSAARAIDRSRASSGAASLRVELVPAEYSGVALVHAPRDWRGYRYLRLDIFNPLAEPLDLVCRIHDGEHDRRGPDYRNRFNAGVRLSPGWNALAFDLAEVKRAPASRVMDMGDIRGFMVFAGRLPAPRTIFIDHVRLE
jgi:VanZ family protein